MTIPREIGVVIERRTTLPEGRDYCVWVVLDRYDPDEEGPTYYDHPRATRLVEGIHIEKANELASNVANTFKMLGSQPLVSTAYDV